MIRVRVQRPTFIVDKLDKDGIKDPFEILTLNAQEVRDLILALEAAQKTFTQSTVYVVASDGKVDVS